MKKNKKTDQKQARQARGLSLSRDTIQVLDAPALLEPARGGASDGVNGCAIGPNTGHDGTR